MSTPNRLLRFALLADAASSAAMGLLLAVGATPLAPILGLPAGLLQPVGIGLLPFAAFVAWVAMRASGGTGPAWAVVILNVMWVVDSVTLLAWPGLHPTGLGQLFVAAQALAVGSLALVQAVALRGRTAGAAAA